MKNKQHQPTSNKDPSKSIKHNEKQTTSIKIQPQSNQIKLQPESIKIIQKNPVEIKQHQRTSNQTPSNSKKKHHWKKNTQSQPDSKHNPTKAYRTQSKTNQNQQNSNCNPSQSWKHNWKTNNINQHPTNIYQHV